MGIVTQDSMSKVGKGKKIDLRQNYLLSIYIYGLWKDIIVYNFSRLQKERVKNEEEREKQQFKLGDLMLKHFHLSVVVSNLIIKKVTPTRKVQWRQLW